MIGWPQTALNMAGIVRASAGGCSRGAREQSGIEVGDRDVHQTEKQAESCWASVKRGRSLAEVGIAVFLVYLDCKSVLWSNSRGPAA